MSQTLAPTYPRRCRFPLFLLALVFFAYLPIFFIGNFIWDDPQYITQNPVLRTVPGLLAIWIHPTSIPQYYPIVHTAFWIEYHLWGLHPLGYHVINVLLHGLGAILLWRALKRLNIPGAALAATIFALHPVQVESVAWATERKNVLSLVFYLLSFHAYLNFTGEDFNKEFRKLAPWLLSFIFFVCALLSKSVTCSLPAAVLLLVYWRNGRVRWRDIGPLVPYFLAGGIMAHITGTLEVEHVGATGSEWPWTFSDRCLIAGRALWFYAAKLLWPHPLAFVYPKWTAMSLAARPAMILFPLSATAAIAALFLLRHRITRGPLVAVLFFAGTLLPALGFVNLFPMRYTFVADHYQYTASIGLIALAAAWLSRRWFTTAVAILVLCVFTLLTMFQQSIYRNELSLWEDTVKKNPDAWMAWGNLGDEYAKQSNRTDLPQPVLNDFRVKARDCYSRLYILAPEQPVTHLKWGIVKEFDNDWEAARAEFETALQLQPAFTPAMNSLGLALMHLNRPEEAMKVYAGAVEIDPGYAEVRYNYGVALEQRGDYTAAADQYLAAIARRADFDSAQFNLANLLLTQDHRPDLAAPYFAAAIAANPARPDYRVNYAVALRALGQLDAARAQCLAALQINPNFAPAQALLRALQ